MSGKAASSIFETIGATPTVRLRRVVGGGSGRLYAKLEHLNPAGSAKDRLALALVERAEASGRLKPGAALVEATSGSLGISLAMVAAARGYRLTAVLPDSVSLETRATLKAYGADVVLVPAEEGMSAAIARAAALAGEQGALFVDQFRDPTAGALYRGMADELVATAHADGGLDAFVCGYGTGAVLSALGAGIKAAFPRAWVIAVEPDRSAALARGPIHPHRIQGLGPGFVPDVLARGVVDRVVPVSDRQAWEMAGRLAREEGLLVGISSGANAWVGAQVALERGPASRVYTVCFDTGERSFSLAEQFA